MSSKRNGTTDNDTLQGSLTERQEAVAACLAIGRTVNAAARECKVGACTIWRWLKVPEFKGRVDELRKELTDRAIGRLADLMAGKALDVLTKRLDAKDKTGKTTATLDDVKAAFDLFLSTTNAAELKARLEALEANQPRGAGR